MKLPAHRPRHLIRAGLVLSTSLAIAGCAGWGGDRSTGPDYQLQRDEAPRDLELPPDIAAPDTERAYRIPEAPGERISARAMQEDPATRTPAEPTAPAETVRVLPETTDVRLMRDGQTRWLVIDAPPEELWQRLAAFWETQHLPLERNDPELGILETEWAEDQAGIPLRGSQGLLSRVVGSVYDATTRDKYRLRIERINGRSEVYITHRGAEEQHDGTTWRWARRPADPELEVEMLNRLRLFLTTGDPGEGGERAPETRVEPASEPELETRNDSPVLLLEGDYHMTWRRLGTTLDRSGLLVDEQHRDEGYFLVTFRPDMADDADEGGFFGRTDEHRANERYRVELRDAGDGHLQVHAASLDGDELRTRDAEFVLERIHAQMSR